MQKFFRTQDGGLSNGKLTTNLDTLIFNTMKSHQACMFTWKEQASIFLGSNISHFYCKILLDHCDYEFQGHEGRSRPGFTITVKKIAEAYEGIYSF